ncbi:MAG: M3 family metallopeptidase, partial [candidate division Zixibacteria bacterium]|nr:M3 family metallopeptidase [candidate division Zixibacteria bacterium]
MTTNTKTTPTALPARDNIDTKHKWNLADIYATEEAWETEFNNAKTLIGKAKDFSGKLTESPQLLYACLETRTELSVIASDLYQYAHLSRDLDNRASKYQAMVDRAAALLSDAGAAYAFVEPELLKIDEKQLVELAAQFEKTDVYDFYIRELIRSRKHIRSEEVEEVLAQSAIVARGSDSIFTMLNDADLQYPSIKDEDGNEVKLTKQRFAKFMESSDRRVRHDAHQAFYSAYKEHVNTLGASLTSSVNTDIFYSRARHFESCLHRSLDGNNIPVEVYHSLMNTTEADLKGLHAYTALRKRILKLDKIMPYDMTCPLFPDQDYEVTFEQAVAKTIEALQPLGEEYISKLKEAF